MNLTKALREWAVANLGVAADATDAQFKAAISAALTEGKMTAKDFAVLTTKEADTTDDPRAELADIVTKAVVAGLQTMKGSTPVDEFESKLDAALDKRIEKMNKAGAGHTPSFANRVMGESATNMPRVKAAVESYAHSRTAALYPSHTKSGRPHMMAGQPAFCGGRPLDLPSNRDKAVMGTVAKWMLLGSNGIGDPAARLNDHERDLLHYALENEKWNGPVGCKGNPDAGVEHVGQLLTKDGAYTLVNDVTTGGAYATPEIWDDAVVVNAVLYGELFPQVEVINLAKGAFVHGITLATDPTILPVAGSSATSGYGYGISGHVSEPGNTDGLGRGYTQQIMEGDTGGAYNTAQQFGGGTAGINYLQDLSGLVGHFDNGIFPVVAAMEVGLDWESDSVSSLGSLLVDRIGIKLQEWLDAVIAIGSGYNQPLGIFGTGVGGTSVTATNSGSQGPLVVGDLEKLLFGLSKAMRASKGGKTVYVMADSQYRLCRSIPWLAGSAVTAQARVFGMDHEAYTLLDHPVKIQNSIPTGYLAFCNLAYYRMYRRLGMNIKMTTEGQSLMLKNSRLIVGRSRWGGKLTKGSALAVMTTAEYPTYGFPSAGRAVASTNTSGSLWNP